MAYFYIPYLLFTIWCVVGCFYLRNDSPSFEAALLFLFSCVEATREFALAWTFQVLDESPHNFSRRERMLIFLPPS